MRQTSEGDVLQQLSCSWLPGGLLKQVRGRDRIELHPETEVVGPTCEGQFRESLLKDSVTDKTGER